MRKVIKNVVKITVGTISTLLVLLITLPLLASLLINVPTIQNAVVKKVMSDLSGKLGTTVSIDRINIKFINHVVAEGLYVEDFQRDTLLYVARLTAPIVEFGLMGEPLTFGKVRLEGAEMWLRRDSVGTINIKHLINAMRSGREEKDAADFRMKIMGIEAGDLTFGLLRWDKPFRDGVDFGRFVIRNTKVDIDDFSIIRDTIRMGIRSLSFDERSGFRMDCLSAHDLAIGSGAVALDNASIRSAGADLDLPYIRIAGDGWSSYRNFLDSVSVDVSMRDSHVTSGFISWFLPAVADWNMTLDDLSLCTAGPVASMSGRIKKGRTLGSSFSLAFSSRGIPDFRRMELDADISSVTTTGGDIDSLMRGITGRGLAESVRGPLMRLGAMELSGKFTGNFDEFAAEGRLGSEAGQVEASGTVAMHGESGSSVDGRISIQGLGLGRLLAVSDMGAVSGDFALNGRLERGGRVEGEVKGTVNALEYKAYTYNDIRLDGRLDNKMFDGNIRSHDENLDLDFAGMLDFNNSVPRYNFALDLRHADLAATGLNRSDSVSLLSGRMTASASGNSLDNLNGTIEVVDPVYISSADTVRTGQITVSGRNSATSKQITLRSEFADADFRSRISYRDMLTYLKDFLRDYIPLLYDSENDAAPLVQSGYGMADAAGYSILNLKVKNTDKLFRALIPGTQLANGSEVSFMFNPFIRNFSLSARSEFIELRNMLATNVELYSDNKADSLTLHLTSKDFYAWSLHIPGMAVHGGARGRQMSLSTRLADARENFSAMLGLRIDSGDGNGDRSIRFRFSPSYISLDEQKWYISARSVVYDTGRTAVNNLRIYSGANPVEELTVDGVISDSPSDTLFIRLNEFDLSPLGRIIDRSGYRVTGKAAGYVDFISPLRNAVMNANIDFDEMSLNGIKAAPLRFASFWDRKDERVKFHMLNRNNNVNVMHGSFAPAKGTVDAVAVLDSLDTVLLDPLLGNILENTKGKANFRLELGGTFKKLRMDGRIEVPSFETTVKYTKAAYRLKNGLIKVEDSRLSLPPTIVRDQFGNTAEFDMAVDLSNLRNVKVDIHAAAHNLLAFNTGLDDNKAFYGQVFATGSLGIRTDKMGTKMDISATTGRGTRFHLPLNAKSNISWADFVVFADPSRGGVDTTNVLARKKQIYERRLQNASSGRRQNPLDLNITVNLSPDAEFHMLIDPNLGNGISAHGQGVINMRINPATNLFSMVGDCSILDGRFEFSMMDIINKDFTITPGSTLVWTGEPDDALLNVEAVYRVRTSLLPLTGDGGAQVSGRSAVPVECLIRLTERLSQPEITFDIHLPSADPDVQIIANNAMNTQELKSTQFLSLLMTGSFAASNSIAGQSANSGATATGAVGFDILTDQLGNFLSNEDYNIYFKYRPQNEYVGNQYDVGFSTGFMDDRLLLEIEGNYVEDRRATSVGANNVSNLAGDVSLTWVIDSAGNLRLKVFSQTIDRLNETQGLQESGLGIYYKKDFDSFRDFFKRNKNTFTNFGDNGRSDSTTAAKTRRKNRKQAPVGGRNGAGVSQQEVMENTDKQ